MTNVKQFRLLLRFRSTVVSIAYMFSTDDQVAIERIRALVSHLSQIAL